MNWLKQAWSWIRKLPVAQYIKPLWKAGLKELVQHGGDQLQNLMRAELKKGLPQFSGKMRGMLEEAEARIRGLASKLPLPVWAGQKASTILGEGFGMLKQRLEGVSSADSMESALKMADASFDEFQNFLKYRIDAL